MFEFFLKKPGNNHVYTTANNPMPENVHYSF